MGLVEHPFALFKSLVASYSRLPNDKRVVMKTYTGGLSRCENIITCSHFSFVRPGGRAAAEADFEDSAATQMNSDCVKVMSLRGSGTG